MVGPLPAGRSWTNDEDELLLELHSSGVKVPDIARKLRRSAGAVHARFGKLKRMRDLKKSLPPERMTFFRAHLSAWGHKRAN